MTKDIKEKIDLLNDTTTVDYPESKEAIWEKMEARLIDHVHEKAKVRTLHTVQWAIAASIIVLLGVGSFLRFYSVEYSTTGNQLAVQLPDGSTVDLNGRSTIQYHPYWWKINRTLAFEGEGYFEVEKGKQFSVQSENGTTTVLGTSFNIYSRDSEYEVSCLTGKVKVEVQSGLQEIIYPNQTASLKNNQLQVSEADASHSVDWRNHAFYFTNTPISRVFREIEVAYNTQITVEGTDSLMYSGNFKKPDNIEDVLHFVCAPLNIHYEKQPTGGYIIKNN